MSLINASFSRFTFFCPNKLENENFYDQLWFPTLGGRFQATHIYFSFESARVEQKKVEVKEEIKSATVSISEETKQQCSPKKDDTVGIEVLVVMRKKGLTVLNPYLQKPMTKKWFWSSKNGITCVYGNGMQVTTFVQYVELLSRNHASMWVLIVWQKLTKFSANLTLTNAKIVLWFGVAVVTHFITAACQGTEVDFNRKL